MIIFKVGFLIILLPEEQIIKLGKSTLNLPMHVEDDFFSKLKLFVS